MLEEMVVAAPLPWSSPIYKRVSGIQSFIELGTILLGNCVLCTILAVCLWAFSNIVDLSGPEKRTFNTCSLLLSASLGFGIGFFFDRIGLLARGKILQSEANTAQGIGLIMRGSLSSYAVFFYRRLKDPKRRFTAVTFIIFGFLICAFIGRFAIGFLGLAFNIVETADYKAPLFRPSWDNKTIGSEKTYLEPSTNLFQTAQSLKGRPDIDSFSYLNYIPEGDEFEALVLNMTDISRFAYNNVSVTVNENTVATVVQLYDFRGQDAVSSERQLVVETGCQRFESNGRIDGAVHYELNGRNEAVPLWSANYTKFPIQELTIGSSHNPLRWIVKDSSRKPEIWILGQSRLYKKNGSPGYWRLYGRSEYIGNMTIVYKCSIGMRFEARVTELHTEHLPDRLAGEASVWGITGWSLSTPPGREAWMEYDGGADLYSYSICRKDRKQSELWLSAYIGNGYANYWRYLNEVLTRFEIEPEKTDIKSHLEVKWGRVWALLGALVVYQVVLGSAAVFSCLGSFEIVDDVWSFSSMFANFPFDFGREERNTSASQGSFFKEGDGYRWVHKKVV